MNSFIATLAGLFLVYATVITTVCSVDLHGVQVTKDELISLTRDHFGRTDPDALLNGFFPVWAVIQFLIAAFFLVIALLSVACYLLGCRTPAEERTKRVK
ncbi:unnamed protein product [Adineta steineri]|uniref:Uncharacterized protein n=1 Tax=Adineta steineri TaxID=433720 RepID=A0A815G9A1_9BILA|nr:unnamed protein product [Adineta steineri]CAF1335698.1 unnamed protein product [Adineta steineri]CAF3508368.1 unnamed protein product [Adineta steineri]CAF3588914.1 unnamed protein product [Adineta steineri]